MWLWFVEIKHFNCLKLVTWPVTAIHSVLHQGSIATLPTLKFVYDIMPPGLIFEQKYWTNKSQFGTPLRDLYHTFALLCWKFFSAISWLFLRQRMTSNIQRSQSICLVAIAYFNMQLNYEIVGIISDNPKLPGLPNNLALISRQKYSYYFITKYLVKYQRGIMWELRSNHKVIGSYSLEGCYQRRSFNFQWPIL